MLAELLEDKSWGLHSLQLHVEDRQEVLQWVFTISGRRWYKRSCFSQDEKFATQLGSWSYTCPPKVGYLIDNWKLTIGHMQIMWFLPQLGREGSDSISFRLWSASWSWSPWPPDSGSPSLCNCRRGSHDKWFTSTVCHMTMVYIKCVCHMTMVYIERMSHDNGLHQVCVTWQWFTSSVYVTWQWFTVCIHLVFSVCELEIVSTIENIGMKHPVCLCAYSLVSMESINCSQPHN